MNKTPASPDLPPLPIAAGMVTIMGSMTEVFTADQVRTFTRAAIGELEKDAARIEWCESSCYFPEYCSHGSVGWYIDGTGVREMPTARAAIDAALAAQKPEASNGR